MKLYHTSPNRIEKIDRYGKFGSMLFFSSEPYFMTATSSDVVLYSIDLDEDKILNIDSVFYRYDSSEEAGLQEVIEHVMHVLEVDQETAENLLDNSQSIQADHVDVAMSDSAEADWFVQEQQGEVAKSLGYEAALTRDEQGSVYIACMFEREKDLVFEKMID